MMLTRCLDWSLVSPLSDNGLEYLRASHKRFSWGRSLIVSYARRQLIRGTTFMQSTLRRDTNGTISMFRALGWAQCTEKTIKVCMKGSMGVMDLCDSRVGKKLFSFSVRTRALAVLSRVRLARRIMKGRCLSGAKSTNDLNENLVIFTTETSLEYISPVALVGGAGMRGKSADGSHSKRRQLAMMLESLGNHARHACLNKCAA